MFNSFTNVLRWFSGGERKVLGKLRDQKDAAFVEEREPGATLRGFRMRRPNGNFSFSLPNTGFWVDLPVSLLDLLGLDAVLGVAIAYDVPVIQPLLSRDELGVEVVGMTSAISINLFREDGQPLNVTDLQEPIALSMPVNDTRAKCAFFKEDEELWSYTGLEKRLSRPFGNETAVDGMACYTRHLTLFGAIIRGFIMALSCAQLQLLSIEALRELLRGEWWASPIAIAYWFLLLFFFALTLTAHVKDRADADRWEDAFFLIPRHLSKPEEFVVTDSMEKEPFSLRACLMAPLQFFLSSAWRDVLDEIASRWFNYFGDVRSFCETMFEGMEMQAGGEHHDKSRFQAISHNVMRSLVSSAARRQASTSLGLSIDTVTFLTDDEQLGKVLFQAALAGNSEQEGIPPHGVEGIMPHVRRLQAWKDLHEEVIKQIDRHWEVTSSWCGMVGAAVRIFLMSNPLISAFFRCHFQTRAQRVMLFNCELLGALMLTCVFTEASGGAASKNNENKECESDGVGEQIGALIAFAMVSLLIAGIPVLLISSLQSRSLQKFDYPDCPGWQRQLASWRAQDKLFWCTSLLYATFCALFVAIFLANVSLADHGPFGLSTSIQLVEDTILIPLGMASFVPAITSLAVSIAWYARGGDRSEMLQECRLEKEGDDGNWHQVVVPI